MPTRSANLLGREVLPFALSLLALGGGGAACQRGAAPVAASVDRPLAGIPGLALILGSFTYSLRKRTIITRGKPVELLRRHERMAWAGALLVLVHAGIHFNALLGWLALAAMLVNVASGLTGKYLLTRSRQRLQGARERLTAHGLDAAEIEERLHRDSLTFDLVKQWRVVHVTITLAFGVLATAHPRRRCSGTGDSAAAGQAS